MAPTLFSMMFSAMLSDAFQDCDDGFPIRYLFDGKLFNLCKVASQIKGADRRPRWALLRWHGKERKKQEAMNRVWQAYDNYALKLSTQKTWVVFQPAPGKPYSEQTITVNWERLHVVDNFTYLDLFRYHIFALRDKTMRYQVYML